MQLGMLPDNALVRIGDRLWRTVELYENRVECQAVAKLDTSLIVTRLYVGIHTRSFPMDMECQPIALQVIPSPEE